ncbi:unnamed protein product [Ectocarpus sp. CCAP 1310/34]|nr:unnamed protein product [Ectocarpus sp. CCAP 1310/34]
MGEDRRAAAPHRSWWRWLQPSLTPPRDLFVVVGLVVVWGVTRGVVGLRDATAATIVPRESGQGESRGTRVLDTEESRRVRCYYAHDDGGYYEDYGDYDDGYHYVDGYYDAGYAHYAGGGDSYSYSSGSVDMNRFHRSLAHACEPLLRETSQQRGIVLTGKLEPYTDCMMAKRLAVEQGVRSPAEVRLAGGNERLLADVGRYDLGRIECFRVDNGTEWTRGDFRCLCDDNGIGVEFTPPGTPKYNGVVESTIWRIMKAGMAARRSAGRVFNVDFLSIPGLDEGGDRLWMKSAKWAAEALDQSATKANPGRRSPHEMFTGEQGPFRVLPLFQPGFMREDRRTKLDDQATPLYYLNGGDNHPNGTVKVLKASTNRVVHTNNVSRVTSAPAGEWGFAAAPATTPPPAPIPSQPPSAASLSPSATPDPDQPPARPNPAMPPLTAQAMRQLRPGTKAEGMKDLRLPSRTRSGTRHSTGLISMLYKNTLVSMLEARSAVDEERGDLTPAEAGEPRGAGGGEQAGALAAADPFHSHLPRFSPTGKTSTRRCETSARRSNALTFRKNTLVSMLEARSAVDEERGDLTPAEAGEPRGAGGGEQAGALAAADPFHSHLPRFSPTGKTSTRRCETSARRSNALTFRTARPATFVFPRATKRPWRRSTGTCGATLC